jgi:hypothetical protein
MDKMLIMMKRKPFGKIIDELNELTRTHNELSESIIDELTRIKRALCGFIT